MTRIKNTNYTNEMIDGNIIHPGTVRLSLSKPINGDVVKSFDKLRMTE